MKKSIINFLILCCIIAVLVIWNGIYMKYILPDHIAYKEEFSLSNLFILTLKGIKEEFIFRYIPFIAATVAYIKLKNRKIKWAMISIIPLGAFILIIQFVFSSLHVPWDPIYREVWYELPTQHPSLVELFNAFLLYGICGIAYCISYFIYIPKHQPLSLLQVKSLLASSFVHIAYNQLVLIN